MDFVLNMVKNMNSISNEENDHDKLVLILDKLYDVRNTLLENCGFNETENTSNLSYCIDLIESMLY